jgi:hypothetical protein
MTCRVSTAQRQSPAGAGPPPRSPLDQQQRAMLNSKPPATAPANISRKAREALQHQDTIGSEDPLANLGPPEWPSLDSRVSEAHAEAAAAEEPVEAPLVKEDTAIVVATVEAPAEGSTEAAEAARIDRPGTAKVGTAQHIRGQRAHATAQVIPVLPSQQWGCALTCDSPSPPLPVALPR